MSISKKHTLILGASTNPERYAYKAAHALVNNGYPIINLGIKSGKVAGEEILLGFPNLQEIDTITLYLNPKNQEMWYEYLLSLKPRRIIFNPGTENQFFEQLAKTNGIETLNACTLVLLATSQY